MPKDVCPQVAGIYESNHDDHKFLLVPTTNPGSCWYAMDAFPCNKHGVKTPGFEYPVPFLASDFGDYVSPPPAEYRDSISLADLRVELKKELDKGCTFKTDFLHFLLTGTHLDLAEETKYVPKSPGVYIDLREEGAYLLLDNPPIDDYVEIECMSCDEEGICVGEDEYLYVTPASAFGDLVMYFGAEESEDETV